MIDFFTLRVWVVVTAFLACGSLMAQEVCGLASVQYNRMHSDGFESSAGSTAASVAGAVTGKNEESVVEPRARPITSADLGKPLGYAAKIALGVAPSIAISFPTEGASLPSRTFEIRGTFTGPVNTGVAVNGSPARTFGNQWVAAPIRPAAGPFTITVVATAFDGLTANASRNVSVGNDAPKIELLAKQPGNIAPAVIGFGLRFGGVVFGNVQIDFNGDSVNDYDGPLAGIPTSYTYAVAGVYTARANVVVDGAATTSETSVVMVDVVGQRERACAVYGELRTALAANNLEASLQAFTTHQQEALRPFFTALGSNRAVFSTRLGTIANGVIGLDGAELTTLRIEAGLPVGYPLGVAAGSDGVWRITSF